jgi:hypothetical protein
MTLNRGNRIWIPCQVKRGPFSDERVVRVESSIGQSLTFVRTNYLKEPIAEGETFVCAVIIEVRGDRFVARIPGQAITSKDFEGDVAKVS